MRVSVSVCFGGQAADNLMMVSANLEKCSRKGNFRKKTEFRLHILEMDNVENISPILNALESFEQMPFDVRFVSLDRSRRDGGDIYWVKAEQNEILTAMRDELVKLADTYQYEYSDKPFMPRLELGSMIIARPDFEVEPFDAQADSVSIVKIHKRINRIKYEELFRKKL